MPQSRVPAGVPAGGQFAPSSRPEASGVELADDDLVEAATPPPPAAPERTIERRLAALARYTDYGPDHDRNVVSALSDYQHFAKFDDPDAAEHYLLLAETRAGKYTWEQFVERDPFTRLAKAHQADAARRAADVLKLTVEELPAESLRPGDLLWHDGAFFEVTEEPERAVSAGQAVNRISVQRHGGVDADRSPRRLDFVPQDVVMGWHYRGDEDTTGDLKTAVEGGSTLSPEALVAAGEEAKKLEEPVRVRSRESARHARSPAREVVRHLFPDGEPLRDRRGHTLLPSELVEQIPELYATEDIPVEDKVICAHYLLGNADWHIAELDRETGEMFGRCDLGLGFPEWGYVRIQELAELEGQWGLPVERDLYFTPKTARELRLTKEQQP